tara:strand:+ start:303 stop:902 length:600 start_codon:yes stop_codon:yes gene_type:complete
MGFDIYGLNPKVKEGSVRPKEIDYEVATEEERKAYWEAKEKFQDENPGEYFRNNVWWWRQLAHYVYENTEEISEADYDEWHMNSGHTVSRASSIRIADVLDKLIAEGHTAEKQKEVEEAMKKAEVYNAKVDKEMEALKQEVIKVTGKHNLAPADYPEVQAKKWDKLYNKRSWKDSYPFSVENVKAFADFCRQSGGFEIC